MDRRDAFKVLGAGALGVMTLADSRDAFAQVARSAPNLAAAAQDRVRRGLPPLKITDVKVFRLAVRNQNLCVCKVFTNEPGLYGVGDGNHAERPFLVAETIEKFRVGTPAVLSYLPLAESISVGRIMPGAVGF